MLKSILFLLFTYLSVNERVQRAHSCSFQTFGSFGEERVFFHSRNRTLFLRTKQKSQHCVRKSLLLCGDKLLQFYLLNGGVSVTENLGTRHWSQWQAGWDGPVHVLLSKQSCQANKYTKTETINPQICTLSSASYGSFQWQGFGQTWVCSHKAWGPRPDRLLPLRYLQALVSNTQEGEGEETKSRQLKLVPGEFISATSTLIVWMFYYLRRIAHNHIALCWFLSWKLSC